MEEQELEEKTENKRNGQLFGLHTNFALAGIQIEFGFCTGAGGGDGDGDGDGGGDEEGRRQQAAGGWQLEAGTKGVWGCNEVATAGGVASSPASTSHPPLPSQLLKMGNILSRPRGPVSVPFLA